MLGVQRRNEALELVVQKNKIGWGWLKSVKMAVGNKGFFAGVEGKLTFFRSGIDYACNYKLKPTHRNFYEDSSVGFNLKWNA
jgi:hypothetical protein